MSNILHQMVLRTDDSVAMFASGLKALVEQPSELEEGGGVDPSEHLHILIRELERCCLESQVTGRVAE